MYYSLLLPFLILNLFQDLPAGENPGRCFEIFKKHSLETEALKTKYYPDTMLRGVNTEQLKKLLEIVGRHLQDRLIDIYVIGSRANGKVRLSKGGGPVRPTSDLDLLLHLKSGQDSSITALREKIKVELASLLGFSVEVHSTGTQDDLPFRFNTVTVHWDSERYFSIINPEETKRTGEPYGYDVAIKVNRTLK